MLCQVLNKPEQMHDNFCKSIFIEKKKVLLIYLYVIFSE